MNRDTEAMISGELERERIDKAIKEIKSALFRAISREFYFVKLARTRNTRLATRSLDESQN